MHMRPRSLMRGSSRTATASGAMSAGLDTALAGFAADVQLQAEVERRGVERALRREALGDLQAVDGVHPGESSRRPGASC